MPNKFKSLARRLSFRKKKKDLVNKNPGSTNNPVEHRDDPKIKKAEELYSAIQLRDIYKEELQTGIPIPEPCSDGGSDALKTYYHRLCLSMTESQQLLHRENRHDYVKYVLAIEAANDLFCRYQEKLLGATKTKDEVKLVLSVKKDYDEFITTLSNDERREHDTYCADTASTGIIRSSYLNSEQIAIKLFAISRKYRDVKTYADRYAIYERKLTKEQVLRVGKITTELYLLDTPILRELNGLYLHDTKMDCDAILESAEEEKIHYILYSDPTPAKDTRWIDNYINREMYETSNSDNITYPMHRFFHSNEKVSEKDSAISEISSMSDQTTYSPDSIESSDPWWRP